MRFATILERNRRFVQGRARTPLPPSAPLPLIVVACHDPRLDPLLRPALGLADDEALILRAPAAGVAPESSTLRNLCVAVHMFDAEEVLVLGHTSCRMADFDTSAFIEAFRKRGVPREAFGSEDIRTWVGAIPDPRRGVLSSIAAITASPCLPRGLPVGGLVLDDETGGLEVVLKPGEAMPAGSEIAADTTTPAGKATSPSALPTGASRAPASTPRPASPRRSTTAR